MNNKTKMVFRKELWVEQMKDTPDLGIVSREFCLETWVTYFDGCTVAFNLGRDIGFIIDGEGEKTAFCAMRSWCEEVEA